MSGQRPPLAVPVRRRLHTRYTCIRGPGRQRGDDLDDRVQRGAAGWSYPWSGGGHGSVGCRDSESRVCPVQPGRTREVDRLMSDRPRLSKSATSRERSAICGSGTTPTGATWQPRRARPSRRCSRPVMRSARRHAGDFPAATSLLTTIVTFRRRWRRHVRSSRRVPCPRCSKPPSSTNGCWCAPT